MSELGHPQGKTGWPRIEESPSLPEAMPDGRPWPKVSIVTPNYNYGRYLEDTIRSVLLQGYPNLEYIIIDGGSTDGSVEIIRKYEPWLAYWVSEPDHGQVDGINKGLHKLTGEWFNWLNSDDVLLPGSLRTLATISSLVPDAQWISGATVFVSETGAPVDYSVPWRDSPTVLGFGWPNFPQDATFVRVDFMRRHGIELRSDLAIFDTIFHWMLAEFEFPLLTPACLSSMRWHPQQVTANVEKRAREIRAWLEPLRGNMPLWIKIWHRLLKTRYLSTLFRRILGFCVWYGLTPASRKPRAIIYDRWRYQWKLVPARRAVFF